MNIWHVDNKHYSTLLLCKLEDGNFRVIQDGIYAPLLCGADYTLLHKKYAAIFKGLTEEVTLRKVKVLDYSLHLESNNYIELRILNTITPITFKTMNDQGEKLWVFNGHLFISDILKQKLEIINANELVFHQGFEMFGG